MVVQPGLCEAWPETQKTVFFSQCGSYFRRSHTRERSESRHRTDPSSKRPRTDDKDYGHDSGKDVPGLDRDIKLEVDSDAGFGSYNQWRTEELSRY